MSRLLTVALSMFSLLWASVPARAEGMLKLYFFPSPKGIDWTSPSKLAWSTIKNELSSSPYRSKHSIGHVNIEIRCPVEGQSESRILLTGMTSDGESLERDALLKEKIGLGVIFRNYPGKLETPEYILSQLPERFVGGGISSLDIRVSDSTCHRLLQFHDEYRDLGYGAHYGLPNRPRYGEGAGCTAYGTAYLEVAGLLTPEMKEKWAKTIRVPIDMIGGGEADTPKRKVSVIRLLFSFWRKWATPEQPHRELFFWDPDSMHSWIHEVFHSSRTDFGRISMDRSLGLTWDARAVPTPTDPLWR